VSNLSIIDTTAETVSSFSVKRPSDMGQSVLTSDHYETARQFSAPASNGNVTVTRKADGQVMDAHRQWANRPADEAVFSFDDLLARTRRQRFGSTETQPVKWGRLQVGTMGDELRLFTPGGNSALMTNFAMSRLAAVAGAPAEYLGKLPAQLAADCLNEGLKSPASNGSVSLLVANDRIRAMTSERYERVWDHEIAALAYELHTRGTWGSCQAFRSAGADRVSHAWGDSKPLPLGWVGDRSSFIALADYEGAVDVNGTKLARFALLSNSEVGAASLKITFGLMDFACANFILWGCQQVTEVSIRHIGSIRERFMSLTAPMTRALSSGERDDISSAMRAASRTLVADTKVETLARAAVITKLPAKLIQDAWNRAEATERYGDPRSVWGMLSGLTEASQHAADYADKRVAIDESAARLMSII